MADGNMVSIRDSIIAWVKANVPDLAIVEKHGGKFDINEIQRILLNTPAVYVTIQSAQRCKSPHFNTDPTDTIATGQILFDVEIACFVVTSDAQSVDADVSGLNIAEQLMITARLNTFGNANSFPAHSFDLRNFWTVALDQEGMCIIGVRWLQPMLFGSSIIDAVTLQTQTQLVGTPVLTINENTTPAARSLRGAVGPALGKPLQTPGRPDMIQDSVFVDSVWSPPTIVED